MYNEEFHNFLISSKQRIFIDAEGREDKIKAFIQKYNSKYNESVSIEDYGISINGE